MKGYYYDKHSKLVNEHFAVIYAPKRRRDRYAENCVQIFESADEAMQQSDIDNNRFAAKVLGPARSSEGLRLYYLVKWLA